MSASIATTPPVATTGKCTICGEAGKYQCKKCNEGLDAAGVHQLTHYCGAACQTTHWPVHKDDCKLKRARMRLWRAGELLRKLAYIHTHATALVKLPAGEYESKKAILLNPFATKMAELLDQARQAGSFDRWVARMAAGSK
ncbi:hypothetical protein LTR95_010337 [Oleoguttula sp. CCFEE 5521]